MRCEGVWAACIYAAKGLPAGCQVQLMESALFVSSGLSKSYQHHACDRYPVPYACCHMDAFACARPCRSNMYLEHFRSPQWA